MKRTTRYLALASAGAFLFLGGCASDDERRPYDYDQDATTYDWEIDEQATAPGVEDPGQVDLEPGGDQRPPAWRERERRVHGGPQVEARGAVGLVARQRELGAVGEALHRDLDPALRLGIRHDDLRAAWCTTPRQDHRRRARLDPLNVEP